MIIPPFLQKGDWIGLTCPASYLDPKRSKKCIQTLQEWGLQVMAGKTLQSTSPTYFSGTDEERADELQAMLDDSSIRAILFGRGGYGCSRIIDRLDFSRFKKHPKWLIGFSDVTAFHCHLNRRLGIASVHASMAWAFDPRSGSDPDNILDIKKILFGKTVTIQSPTHPLNKKGQVTGEIIGGNLSLLIHCLRSRSEPIFDNKILFIEDVGEYLYGVDRMMVQLQRSGILSRISGLIFGGFTDGKDTERPFGKMIDELLYDHVCDLNIPVCFDFPVSHGPKNRGILCGEIYDLTVRASGAKLKPAKKNQ
ncbi:MAG: LD-carboxypeptidase [Ferruginibacter sp.]